VTRRRLLALAGAAALGLPLAACGRKGKPEEPEGRVYPRIYPYTPLPGISVPPARRDDPDQTRRDDADQTQGQTP